ncbi:MAG: shikimate kinase [Ignavibacteriales bacterium]|nr:shikimate kinase [Ignavibacteriales bacterium]
MVTHNRIYLTGFMGSGKSTLAPLIANVFGFDVVDLDTEIEKRTGTIISEIFQTHGEAYFRKIEQELLLETMTRQNIVVALGGGAIAFGNNLQVMKDSGLLVYLKVEPEEILRRVKRIQNRPLLKDKDGVMLSDDSLRNRISSLLLLREPYFNQADITILFEDASIALTVDRIVRLIRNHIQT